MQDREISQAVIGRLPRYYRYLGDLKEQGKSRISSQELSDIMKVTASQIRQDFNNFGGFGQQGYGYNIEHLHAEIGKILGLDKKHGMFLLGAGHLGQALLKYADFALAGFGFTAAFDADESLWGVQMGAVSVQPPEEIPAHVEKHPGDIAVLAIPRQHAQAVAARLVEFGTRAIWNFAPVDLELPPEVIVENVHLQDSLMKLSYKTADHEKTT